MNARALNSALVLLVVCSSCVRTQHCACDLSMQFAHPELYVGRTSDDQRWVREMALTEMRSAGLLKRGMSDDAIKRLLGEPEQVVDFDGFSKLTYTGFHSLLSTEDSAVSPREEWSYRLRVSYLTVEFDRGTRKVRRYERAFDRPEGIVFHEDEVW